MDKILHRWIVVKYLQSINLNKGSLCLLERVLKVCHPHRLILHTGLMLMIPFIAVFECPQSS